jgi:3-phosphoshikimate 1-carboxyvinyltransferase
MPHAAADTVVVRPARGVSGHTRVPGDKSISHRYAMLAALADGTSSIAGYSGGADCRATLACLGGLGVEIFHRDDKIVIAGRGLRGLAAPSLILDADNSGTTLRLLSGILAAHPMTTTITGDRSLRRRPMARVIDPLTRMGAAIASDGGRPPLTIQGADLRSIAFEPDVPSAQVKSAVLLAGLHADGTTSVTEPAATRDHTERALAAFGVTIRTDGPRVTVEGGQRLRAASLRVPGDFSSAAFWIALAAGTPGARIEIDDVGLNPTRTHLLDVVRRAGARIEARTTDAADGEPIGRLTIAYGAPASFTIEPAEVPALIDEIPALAAMTALMPAGAEMTVTGAAELRVKESDRISALAAGLRALGAEITELPHGFHLTARPLAGGLVDAHGDHRLAMAFAVAATAAQGHTAIAGGASVAVSYPGFFATLEQLTRGDGR